MHTLSELLVHVRRLPAAALRPGADADERQAELQLLAPLLPRRSIRETNIIRRGCVEHLGVREVRVRIVNRGVHDLVIRPHDDTTMVTHNGAAIRLDTIAEFRDYLATLCEPAATTKASAS